MWPFRTRDKAKGHLIAPGFTDWHSHILPGVDDGVRTMDEALDILRAYESMGVQEVWLTPHIMEEIPNTPLLLRKRFAELTEAYDGGVRLFLGAENMLDNLFVERLACNDLLPVGENGDRLLVETSYFSPPMGLYEMLDMIKSHGYIPVLAHPERYMYMTENDYRRLKEEKILLQLNVPSLAGAYGKHVKEKAEWLKKHGFYDCEGTDIHNIKMLPLLKG